ncbi:TonB-dependent receptor [Halomonas sp. DP8Y7-1]|uniref:TonB-dependent receptor n=1 Tax=Halomonas sp. DP8Y7-1 TaxID=2859078 RepID=UPI001C97DB62|nr:TonB-dependent receptor [Halomonas sp. DP8Y7-1]MBY6029222.1 TonB-dependent receptor [Halomonas sp. DP8Y7-1]
MHPRHPLSHAIRFPLACDSASPRTPCRSGYAALLLTLATPATALAQNDTSVAATTTQAEVTADTMVVVGSRTPKSISEIPGAVWVVDQQQLNTQIATGADLKTALGRLVPGLDLAPQGRTNYGQNMRGRSVQVLIDGVSLNSSRGLSRQFDAIDPFNIERVEVLSGASSLYGGGATGGIINIVTKKGEGPGRHFSTATSVTSGFNDSDDADFRLAQDISGGNEQIQGRLAVAYQDNGRFYDGRGDEIFPDIAQTDLQDNRSIDIMGSVDVRLAPQQTLTLGAQLYRSAYEGDRGLYFPNLTLGNLDGAEIRDGYSSDRDPATDRRMVNLQYHHADLLGQDFYLQAFYREEEASFNAFPYATSEGIEFRTSKQNTDLGGIKALFDADLSDSVSLTYGVDMDRESFDANQMLFDIAASNASGGLTQQRSDVVPRYPSYEVDGYAGFAQGDWRVTEGLTLSAGIRQQHMDVEVDDFNGIPGGENDYDATLLNASALYDYGNGHQNWIQFSQGFELPDPAKYYGKSADVSVDDNPLDAIKTDQVELGWRFNNADWSTQAALYYAWSDKAVENAEDLSVSVVEENKRDYGLEAAVTRYLDGGFEVGGTLHLVRSEQEDDDGQWNKRDARYASLSSATAFVGWNDMAAGRSARLQANHAHNLEDDNDRQIDGYTTVDLALAQDIDIGRLTLGIENLLDEEYSTVWGQRAAMFYSPYYGPEYLYDYQGRGRTFTLGWTMDF